LASYPPRRPLLDQPGGAQRVASTSSDAIRAQVDAIGGVIDSRSFAADSGGYEQLIIWALGLGAKLMFAIEGTGSYGAGLTSAVRRRGVGAVEVMRTDRRDRRLRGKSDTLHAENAARAVLSGNATAIPKTNDGTVEMIRQVKTAKDLAVKGRSASDHLPQDAHRHRRTRAA